MLDNLTDHENRIYDNLLVEMGRKEPYEDLPEKESDIFQCTGVKF